MLPRFAASVIAVAAMVGGASSGAAQEAEASGRSYWVCSILVPASIEPPAVDHIVSSVFQDGTPEAEREAAQASYADAFLLFAAAKGLPLVSNVPGRETDPYCMPMDDEPGIEAYRSKLLLMFSTTIAVRRNPIEWTPPGAVAVASDPVPPFPPSDKPGRIGVRIDVVSKNAAQRLGVPFKIGFSDTVDGAWVTEVLPEGTAQESGLQMLDVITEIAGQRISTPEDMMRIIAAQRPGTLVPVSLVRFGEFKTLDVLIGE